MRRDLKQHLIVGFIIGFVVTLFATGVMLHFGFIKRDLTLLVPVFIGAAVGYAAGWAKEFIWDASGRGVVDTVDLHYTARGAALGSAVAGLINVFFVL